MRRSSGQWCQVTQQLPYDSVWPYTLQTSRAPSTSAIVATSWGVPMVMALRRLRVRSGRNEACVIIAVVMAGIV